MPFFMLGWDYVKIFWKSNWYLAVVFLVAFVTLNAYFLHNWKLFSLLEKEDWRETCRHLEERIYEKKKETRQSVRILINTYIVLSDSAKLEKLSRYLEEEGSRFFTVFALELGIPLMVKGDPGALKAYFSKALQNPKARKKDWLRWNLAFALMAEGSGDDREKAADELAVLAGQTKDPVLLLLAAYLLDKLGETRDDTKKLTASVRDTLKRKDTRSAWEKVSRDSKNNLIVLILSKLLEDAENWFWEEA
jgi:hypothetical protein